MGTKGGLEVFVWKDSRQKSKASLKKMSSVMEKAAQLFEPLFSYFGSWTVSYSVKTVICRAVKGAP